MKHKLSPAVINRKLIMVGIHADSLRIKSIVQVVVVRCKSARHVNHKIIVDHYLLHHFIHTAVCIHYSELHIVCSRVKISELRICQRRSGHQRIAEAPFRGYDRTTARSISESNLRRNDAGRLRPENKISNRIIEYSYPTVERCYRRTTVHIGNIYRNII